MGGKFSREWPTGRQGASGHSANVPIHCLLWPSSSPVLPPWVSVLLTEPRGERLQHPMAGTARQGEMAKPAAAMVGGSSLAPRGWL